MYLPGRKGILETLCSGTSGEEDAYTPSQDSSQDSSQDWTIFHFPAIFSSCNFPPFSTPASHMTYKKRLWLY